MATRKTTALATRKSAPFVSPSHQPTTKPRHSNRARKCEISPEDKVAIVALNLQANEDDVNNIEVLERAMGFDESAGMATLFERVHRKLRYESADANYTLAKFVASILEASKRCGIA
jgi:hypothetical protein